MVPLITLTTDFGQRDPYVAAIKGVIAGICPDAAVQDLSHEVAPQGLLECALFLAGAAPYFPPRTIHVIVVDPGVGTAREAVIVRAAGQVFVCPDNGVLTLFLRDHPLEEVRSIQNPAFMREDISATFHGRDIFAPAAAHLASGRPMADAGPVLDSLVQLSVPQPTAGPGTRVTGEVIHVDHFGNLITNIPRSLLQKEGQVHVVVRGRNFGPLRKTYSAAAPGEPLVLTGSTGYIEIAINGGNASEELGLGLGAMVAVK